MSSFRVVTSAACSRAPSRRVLTGLAILFGASSLAFLSGCGANGSMNLASLTSGESQGASFGGKLYGGQAPVQNAAIYLEQVSTSGYATAPTPLYTTTTGSDGSFSFPVGSWTCHAAPNDQVLLIGVGGNPGNSGGTVNPNLVQMVALGSCSSIGTNTFVSMNEVTTVASAYSLAQFLSYTSGSIDTFPTSAVAAGTIPYIGIPTSGASCNSAGKWLSTGAKTCNYLGLKNAMLTVQNLVNISTGLAPSNSKLASYGTANGGNDSYVPSSRINTLADILSSCVNSTGGTAGDGTTSCGTLFQATTPISTGVAPKDTLQAILNLAQMPYFSSTTLTGPSAAFFGLATQNAPFNAPAALSAAPNDWTIALGYTAGGFANTKIAPGAQDTTYAFGLSIDQQGNVWATSQADGGQSNNGAIVGLNNQGVPISPNTSSSGWGGYTDSGNANLPFANPAIDASGNIFFLNIGNFTLAAINQNDTSVLSPVTLSASAVGGGPTGLALDASDDVWVLGIPSAGTGAGVQEYSGTGGLLTPTYQNTNLSGAGYSGISLDHSGDVWFSSIGGDTELNSSGGLIHFFAGANNEGQLSVNTAGDVYGCQTAYIYEDIPGTTPSYVLVGGTGARNGCNSGAEFAPNAFDGNGNLWEPVLSSAGTTPGHLDEVIATGSSAGNALSPATYGYQGIGTAGAGGSSTGEGSTILISSGLNSGQSITGTAVDGSGNVWVENGYANSNVATHQLVEFVGLAGPTVTPTALAVQYNTLTQLP